MLGGGLFGILRSCAHKTSMHVHQMLRPAPEQLPGHSLSLHWARAREGLAEQGKAWRPQGWWIKGPQHSAQLSVYRMRGVNLEAACPGSAQCPSCLSIEPETPDITRRIEKSVRAMAASLAALPWPLLRAPAPVEESHSLEGKTATRRKHSTRTGFPHTSFPAWWSSLSPVLA